jgi:hypothetical protein
MQDLYNAVRGTGAVNLVLVAGLDRAYDLSGAIQDYALNGFNIVYDSHIYVHWHNTQADIDANVGTVATKFPVAVTELGSYDCSTNLTWPLLQYLYAPMGSSSNRISWTASRWNSPGSCGEPSVIADWSGTPLSGQGQLIHDALVHLHNH